MVVRYLRQACPFLKHCLHNNCLINTSVPFEMSTFYLWISFSVVSYPSALPIAIVIQKQVMLKPPIIIISVISTLSDTHSICGFFIVVNNHPPIANFIPHQVHFEQECLPEFRLLVN